MKWLRLKCRLCVIDSVFQSLMLSAHRFFVKYITVSLVPISVAQSVTYLLISVVPRSTLASKTYLAQMFPFPLTQEEHVVSNWRLKIRIKCLRRLAKEECGSETDRPDIRGGPICNDIALITPPTHLLDLYTIYGMKYQGFIFRMVHNTIFYRPYLSCNRRLKKVHLYTLYIFASELKRNILTK